MVPFVTFRHKALQLRNHYSDFFSLDTHHLDQQGGLTLTVVLHCKLHSLLVLTITIYSVMGRSVWASCICGHQVLLLYATSGNVGCCSSATDFSAKLQETSILSGIPQLDCNLISLCKSLAKHALFRSWTWSLTQLPKMWGAHCSSWASSKLQHISRWMEGCHSAAGRDCTWNRDSGVLPTTPKDTAGFSLTIQAF